MTVSNARFLAWKAELECATKAQTEPMRVASLLLFSVGMVVNMSGRFVANIAVDHIWEGLLTGMALGMFIGMGVLLVLIYRIRGAWKRANPIESDSWSLNGGLA